MKSSFNIDQLIELIEYKKQIDGMIIRIEDIMMSHNVPITNDTNEDKSEESIEAKERDDGIECEHMYLDLCKECLKTSKFWLDHIVCRHLKI